MSIRSLVEFNHDNYPNTEYEKQIWLEKMLAYLSSGDPQRLPNGATFFRQRHHTDESELGEPPYGWNNKGQKVEPTK